MYISTSNILSEVNTSASEDGGANPLSYLLNRDFSEIYRSGTTSNFFRIEIEEERINYIAIAGLDVAGKVSNISFEYWDGVQYVVDGSYDITSDRTIMHVNTSYNNYSKWRVTFTKILSNEIVGVAYMSAGACWSVPYNGELGGYARPWSTPSYKQRTQTNLGMPTQIVIESIGVSGTLNLNNIKNIDIDEVWVPLQGYAVQNGMFIVEEETIADRAYYCYNCVPSAVKAHNMTRKLQNVSIKFSCWTGNVL